MSILRVVSPGLFSVLLALGCTGSADSGGNHDEGNGDGDEDDNSTGGTDGSDGGSTGLDTDPSPGCEAADSTYSPGTTEGSIDASGTRSFRVHVPPGYEARTPTPIVLMFHGGGGSGLQFQTASARMDAIADREGFITVYPEGTGTLATWNGGICCGRAVLDDVDDVTFVSELLDHLETELCVDRNRVFASGMSNGGILSHRLACELSERFAAVAPVAGTIGVTDCAPTRPVPVMHIHGREDGHVPWDGGMGCGPSSASFTSVPSTMEGWRMINECEATQAEIFTEGDGTCTAYDGCAAPVVLCTIDGAGHSWPGGEPGPNVADCPEDGPQSQTFSASEAAWQFFSENPRP